MSYQYQATPVDSEAGAFAIDQIPRDRKDPSFAWKIATAIMSTVAVCAVVGMAVMAAHSGHDSSESTSASATSEGTELMFSSAPLAQPNPEIYDNAQTTQKGCTCKSSCMTEFAFYCYDQPFCLVESKDCASGEADYSYTHLSYYDYCTWSEDTTYEAQSASTKADQITQLVTADEQAGTYPNPAGIFTESVRYSFEPPSDVFTLPDRKKYIHSVGVVVPFKFTAAASSKYTGVFQGADRGLIRFSSATMPSSSGFTPGAGIKIFRDGVPSANFVAMPTLDAQSCSDSNFFSKVFTNHPGGGAGLELELLAKKFWQGSSCPHMVGLSDVASFDAAGTPVESPVFPFELRLQPAEGLSVTIPCDDYLHQGVQNLAAIPVGTKLFDVMALETPTSSPEKIGTFETTGAGTTSAFGDARLFFKHQWIEDDFAIHPEWLKEFDVKKVCGMSCVGTVPPAIDVGCTSPLDQPFSKCPFKDLY